MSAPSEDYVNATKLIETFSSFFDKINTVSTNQDLNTKKLSQLKKALYQNINSSDKILSASQDLCSKRPEALLTSIKTSSQINNDNTPTGTPQKDELYSSSFSQAFTRSRSLTPNVSQSGLNKLEIKQIASQEGFGESLYDKTLFSTEFLPSTSFLALIKAASHSDMSKLFSLTSNYANIRTFGDHQQPVFTALCFCYFEKLLKEKGTDLQAFSQSQKENKHGNTLEAKESEFLVSCKSFLNNSNSEADIIKKFYESISMNPKLYHQAISLFKTFLAQVPSEKQPEVSTKTESFEWMNEIDTIADATFFQNLAQLFNSNLRFLILTNDKLIEKAFNLENQKKELTIFYDKTWKSAFILYPLKKITEDDIESSLYQKFKAKTSSSNSNLYQKPPLNSDSLKSLKSFGIEYANGSLTTLDTAPVSSTSLNDVLENKEKEKEKPIQPRILSLSKPQHLRKANTLNVFTNSLNECSTSFTYPESAVVRPSSDKIIPPSPHSASKELGYFRSRVSDEEDSLTPKGKEPAPKRMSSFYTQRENSTVEERIPELPAQNLAQKLSREVLQNKNFFLERSSTQEYRRPYMSDSKSKGDYSGSKTYSMDFSVGEFSLRRGSERPSAMRPTVVPIAVKSRFDRFNQTINKNDQEVINVTNKYLKKENNEEEQPSVKGTSLTSIMNAYQTIMNQTKDNGKFRPTIGAALKMDD